MAIYSFKVKNAVGADVSLAEYKDKVIMIVNTATGCGFTPQYEGLQRLYDKYKDRGFVILDFPCNQFANQAPGTTFPQFRKIDVNGENESPLYTYLKREKSGMLGSKIKWNFTKFLIDRNGKVVERYAPTVTPEKMEEKIVELLNA